MQEEVGSYCKMLANAYIHRNTCVIYWTRSGFVSNMTEYAGIRWESAETMLEDIGLCDYVGICRNVLGYVQMFRNLGAI